jgi:hypothetical protein
MRIKMCGDACVQMTDRGSGVTVVGTGTSAQVNVYILIEIIKKFC